MRKVFEGEVTIVQDHPHMDPPHQTLYLRYEVPPVRCTELIYDAAEDCIYEKQHPDTAHENTSVTLPTTDIKEGDRIVIHVK